MLSGITGYYVVYFLLTLLVVITTRKKMQHIEKAWPIFGFAVFFGMTVPFFSELLGLFLTILCFIILTLIIVFFTAPSYKQEAELVAQEGSLSVEKMVAPDAEIAITEEPVIQEELKTEEAMKEDVIKEEDIKEEDLEWKIEQLGPVEPLVEAPSFEFESIEYPIESDEVVKPDETELSLEQPLLFELLDYGILHRETDEYKEIEEQSRHDDHLSYIHDDEIGFEWKEKDREDGTLDINSEIEQKEEYFTHLNQVLQEEMKERESSLVEKER
jgi:hypothetical protein